MTNGPERIWLDETSEDEDGFFICEGEKRHGNMDIEYIRADLAHSDYHEGFEEGIKVGRKELEARVWELEEALIAKGNE